MKYNLSEITEVIKNRRTIKPENFSDRKVHREIVENLLNNAIWAPTHGLTQPWRFKVFMGDSRDQLADFQSDLYKSTSGDLFKPRKYDLLKSRPLQASAVIAICMSRQETEKIPEIEEIQAVACAVQNMHLTCTAYGLGGYWNSSKFTYSDEMKNFLNLNEKDKCLGFFYIGYPNVEWPKGQRRPIEYVTDWL